LLRLRALQGDEAETSVLIASAIERSQSHPHWAAAVLYNGLARYEAAEAAARQASKTPDPWVSTWVLPELVEAAARGEDVALARDALDRLTATTQPSGSDIALGIEARCRALLSHDADADALYREAIDRLGRTQVRPELARAHLLYGEWLRREGRRTDAQAQLRMAYDMLAGIGMAAFAERARRELIAAGEKARRRSAETVVGLTAQQALIARLAAEGHTNLEIGTQLFLSPRTVEWHLRNIFIKLDVSSRRELRAALSRSRPADEQPA
jgi:DNA-binding CsgD family transcriptional regulator